MRDDDYVRLIVIGSFTYLLKSISLIQIIYFSSILDLIMSLSGLKSSMIQWHPAQWAPYYGHRQIFSI